MSTVRQASVADYLRLAGMTSNESLRDRWLRYAEDAYKNQPCSDPLDAVPGADIPREASGAVPDQPDWSAGPGPLTLADKLRFLYVLACVGVYVLAAIYGCSLLVLAIARSLGITS